MPRTGENIYKRKDGRWEARALVNGRYRSLYARSYAEAKQKQRTAGPLMAPAKQPKVRLFEQVAADWLAATRLRVKASTYGKYERIVRLHILPALEKQRMDRINQAQIERFATALIESGLSPKAAQDVLMVTKTILKYAKCAIDFSAITIKCEPKEMRALSKFEQDILAQYIMKNADAAALGVLLALYTGIRVGELCALRWENIDLAEGILHVKYTMQRIPDFDDDETKTKVVVTSPKSKCSVRTIPLPDFLINLLEQITENSEAYFLTGTRYHFIEPRTMQNRFKAVCSACGIANVNFHCLRHSFATRCVELGFDAKTLSEILGHSSVNITLGRYVHSSLDLKRAHMAKLSHSPSEFWSMKLLKY